MAEWQMSSWQAVRPAEPGEDAEPTRDAVVPPEAVVPRDSAPAVADESSPWQRRADNGGRGTRSDAQDTVRAAKAGVDGPGVDEPAVDVTVVDEAAVHGPRADETAEDGPGADETAVHETAVHETAGAEARVDVLAESAPAGATDTVGKRRAPEGPSWPSTPVLGFRSTPVPMPPDVSSAPARESHGQPHEHFDPGLQGQLPPVVKASALDLTNALLVRQVVPPPASGWRKWIHTVTGRRVNPGNSAHDERMVRLTRQVDRHLVGCYRISVLSLKGGVGKTTTTATLGSTFSSIRGDRVIAVDANPDRGTLSQKVPLDTSATVRNLLRDIDELDRYSDIRGYTSQNRFRLEVLASDSDPAVSEAFSGQDYDKAVTLLEKFYSIVLTDCGTGLMHSAMSSILAGSDALVVVSSSSVDGARSASATLDWLDAHGHSELVRSSVAVVNAVRPRSGKVDLAKVVEHFEQRCRQVVLIPFDPHLEEGAEIDLDRLKSKTRSALLELAAAVASGFPSNRPEDVQRVRDQRARPRDRDGSGNEA